MSLSTPKTFFLVDDDLDDAELLAECFRTNNFPHTFFMFSSGAQLIREINTRDSLKYNAPDCIVIDYNMPEINGIETVKMLRGTKYFATTPIIMFSTSNFKTTVEMSYNAGVNYYITKPAHIEDLEKAVFSIDKLIEETIKCKFK